VHKSLATEFCTAAPNTYFWILNVERTTFHPPGAWNFEVASRFLENLWTPLIATLFILHGVQFDLNINSLTHVAYLLRIIINVSFQE
jgi:hypothetical protein